MAGPCLPLLDPGRPGPLRRRAGRSHRRHPVPPSRADRAGHCSCSRPAWARQFLQLGHLADASAALEGRFFQSRPSPPRPQRARRRRRSRPRPDRPAHRRPAADRTYLGHRPGHAQVRGARDREARRLAAGPASPGRRRPRPGPPMAHGAGRGRAPVLVPALPPYLVVDPQLVRIALASGDRELAESGDGRRRAASQETRSQGTGVPSKCRPRPLARLGQRPAARAPSVSWKPTSGGSRRLPPWRIWPWPRSGWPPRAGRRRPRRRPGHLRRVRGSLGPGPGPGAPAREPRHPAPPARRRRPTRGWAALTSSSSLWSSWSPTA